MPFALSFMFFQPGRADKVFSIFLSSMDMESKLAVKKVLSMCLNMYYNYTVLYTVLHCIVWYCSLLSFVTRCYLLSATVHLLLRCNECIIQYTVLYYTVLYCMVIYIACTVRDQPINH